ncbi:hypothetical protein FRC02_010718 [Tulasnella sp. 418]|nr:hypothetical protein FRC02_010718 [Tulasnella sp. 418]
MATLTAAGNPQFTCLSCSIAFLIADDQREHYKSDHHRYNMKRRVASLPPISLAAFNEKVLERRAETAITTSLKGTTCEICKKVYTTENAYRSHVQSKRHRVNEAREALKAKQPSTSSAPETTDDAVSGSADAEEVVPASQPPVVEQATSPMAVDEEVDNDAEMSDGIEQRIAAARNPLTISHCLFCPLLSESLEENLTHMSSIHSFFIPDAEFLVDLPGLITYLGEKLAIGNVCLYCNGKGRELRSLDAVRKHMLDKSHCKIAYDSEKDRLEVSDFYDFSASYPGSRRKRKSAKKEKKEKKPVPEDDEWEDEEGSIGDADEVIQIEIDEDDASDEAEDEDEDELEDNNVTYGDSPYELVLPSGSRIGHRSMRRYYVQNFRPQPWNTQKADEDPNSGAALVRRLIADKNSALVPTKGGFGAFGSGTQVVKARNKGEAKEAGRHVREFRDQARREAFKTKVGFVHNHQKHYRDPLLQ